MKSGRVFWLILLLISLGPAARGQYVSVAGGGLFSPDSSAAAPAVRVGVPASAEFSASGIAAVDAGLGLLPFLGAGLHYSYARPELSLRRGDAFGSSALVRLGAHTVTVDARLRSPQIYGFRLYGLAGVGVTRFLLDVKRQVEVPFPGGAPDSVLSPVLTFAGGVERSIVPLVRWKAEVRDYVTPISEKFFQPGGAWHRVAVLGGIVFGW